MNEHYEKVFENYPSYPKFSMWRMMTKIWMKEIYEKNGLHYTLNQSFIRILRNHREKNVKESMNTNFGELNFETKTEMPKNLYINLKTKRKHKSSTKMDSHKHLMNIPHTCYLKCIKNERKLLSGYLQSTLDVSLNEINIHYLECSDIPTNYPY
mmetsp:Transcript_28526/g.25401  ORF Transcript_28526/g.25401 Transcript_28526/m.25401 type:complete len:154 (-) Transcript_28526:1335-1796(-)